MDLTDIKAAVLDWKARNVLIGVVLFICLTYPHMAPGVILGLAVWYCWVTIGDRKLNDCRPGRVKRQ